jgi:uncharacterized protein YndB with AHSA1/START domain
MTTASTDRIERRILLRAPRSRVWRALTDSSQFGEWFGVTSTSTFVPGARIREKVQIKGYEHLMWDVVIEEMIPEQRFSWRWHPGSEPPVQDEPTTLVVFELEDAPGGTLLRVIETGFDALPPSRYEKAFRENNDGWTEQMEALERHVSAHA